MARATFEQLKADGRTDAWINERLISRSFIIGISLALIIYAGPKAVVKLQAFSTMVTNAFKGDILTTATSRNTTP